MVWRGVRTDSHSPMETWGEVESKRNSPSTAIEQPQITQRLYQQRQVTMDTSQGVNSEDSRHGRGLLLCACLGLTPTSPYRKRLLAPPLADSTDKPRGRQRLSVYHTYEGSCHAGDVAFGIIHMYFGFQKCDQKHTNIRLSFYP